MFHVCWVVSVNFWKLALLWSLNKVLREKNGHTSISFQKGLSWTSKEEYFWVGIGRVFCIEQIWGMRRTNLRLNHGGSANTISSKSVVRKSSWSTNTDKEFIVCFFEILFSVIKTRVQRTLENHMLRFFSARKTFKWAVVEVAWFFKAKSLSFKIHNPAFCLLYLFLFVRKSLVSLSC